MTVKEFLELAPGPSALDGAIVLDPSSNSCVLNSELGTPTKVMEAMTWVNDSSHGYYNKSWKIIEMPPRYPKGTERYCSYCKGPLGKGWSIQYGLEDGYCEVHGRAVPVLDAEAPRIRCKPLPAIPANVTLAGPIQYVYTTIHGNTITYSEKPVKLDEVLERKIQAAADDLHSLQAEKLCLSPSRQKSRRSWPKTI